MSKDNSNCAKKLKINLSKIRCLNAFRRREYIRRDENPSDGRYEVDNITSRLCVLVGEFVSILRDSRNSTPIKCSDIIDFDETVVRLAEHTVKSENIQGIDAYVDVKVAEKTITLKDIEGFDEFMDNFLIDSDNVHGLDDAIDERVSDKDDIEARDIIGLDDFVTDCINEHTFEPNDIDGIECYIKTKFDELFADKLEELVQQKVTDTLAKKLRSIADCL